MAQEKAFDPAINALKSDIDKLQQQINEKKKMVNQLCAYAQREPMYADISDDSYESVGRIRPDQFFGRPQATVIAEYLQMRKRSNLGAAKVREIYDALIEGGYQFNTKKEDIALVSLRNALSKNTAKFVKLPNGTYGLVEWYDKNKVKRMQQADSDNPQPSSNLENEEKEEEEEQQNILDEFENLEEPEEDADESPDNETPASQ